MHKRDPNRPLDRRWGQSARAEVPGFGGERRDPMTGAYHLGNGYRAYCPTLMRFTCPDSLSPFGAGGLNPYAYCAGDPVNRADPSGHLSWQAWMGIGIGTASLGLAVFTAGASIAAAGGFLAAIVSASAVSLAVGTAGIVADITAIASGATEDSDPKASAILGWVSLGAGALGVALARPFGMRSIARMANEGTSEFVAMGGNIRLLTPPYQSAYYFGDNYKGLRRLNIVAHSIHRHGITLLQRHPTDLLTAGQLAHVLEQSFIDIDAYRYVRLVSCFAGRGEANSYAQRFATLINKPVKAYVGPVYVSPMFRPEGLSREMHALYPTPPYITNRHETLVYQMRAFNADDHRFLVDKSRLNYRPVHFVPQRLPLTPPLSP